MPKVDSKQKSAAASSAKAGVIRMRQLTRKQVKTKTRQEQNRTKLVNSFQLTAQVFSIFKNFWKPLGGIILVYLILNVFFSSGISNINSTVASIKADLNNTGVNTHPFLAGVSGFLTLVGSSGAVSSSTGSTLQTTLIVLESLVIIWALRHLLAGQKISIKQAYYGAMTPLVPFLLVIFFILLQLLPIAIGSAVLAAITSALGVISGLWEVLFIIIFILLAAWSIYMVSSSIFALYIVTLPGMQPRDALRSAKKLVGFRRWLILRRVLFLPIFILVVMAAIVIPLILYATFLVAPVFYVLSTLVILFVHAYLYSLYRGLLA